MNESSNFLENWGSFGISWEKDYIRYYDNYKVFIENKTNKTVYVDVANSFRISPKGEAESFYNDMTVTHNSNSGGGASLGLGAVTSALGVGGVVGTLASGVGIGGGSSHGTSITENEAAVLTIPPGGKVEMPAKIYANDKKTKTTKNYEIFKFGPSFAPGDAKPEKWRFKDLGNKLINDTQKYRITYSTQRNFAKYTTLNIDIYVRGILGVGIKTCVADIVVDNGPAFFSRQYHHKF